MIHYDFSTKLNATLPSSLFSLFYYDSEVVIMKVATLTSYSKIYMFSYC